MKRGRKFGKQSAEGYEMEAARDVTLPTKLDQAQKLIRDVQSAIDRWNERSQFKMKGVTNLSRSNLDVIELYARQLIHSGGYNFSGLADPLGGVAQVLQKYGLMGAE
jgi:hypothetical protein